MKYNSKSIEDKDLLDPACGSGGFLVEAVRRLLERYLIKANLKDPDVAKEVLEDMVDRVHGLDIHPFACFISEVNLLFQLVDLYAVVRKKYHDFVLPQLKIFRTDSLLPASARPMELSNFTSTNHLAKTAVEEAERAEEIKRNTYHFVVGNPPYVRIDNLTGGDRIAYKTAFRELLIGKWDLYIPFVHRGLEWLKEDGRFAYIVSNKFFILESGLPLRRWILDSFALERIVDLGSVEVFAESLPAAAIVVARGKPAIDKVRIHADIKTDRDLPDEVRNKLKGLGKIERLETALSYLLAGSRFYTLKQSRFKLDPELLFTVSIPDKLEPLIRKMESGSISLGDICSYDEEIVITEGDMSRKEEGTVINSTKYEAMPKEERQEYQRVIRGDSIDNFGVEWAGLWARTVKAPKEDRVFIKDYSKRPTCAFDKGNYRCLRTIYCAYVKDPKFDPLYVLGVLNSELIHFYYIAYFFTSRPGMGSFRFRTQFLKRLPLKPLNASVQVLIRNLVKKIQATKAKQFALRSKINGFPSEYLNGVKETRLLISLTKTFPSPLKSSYKIPKRLTPEKLRMSMTNAPTQSLWIRSIRSPLHHWRKQNIFANSSVKSKE